MKKFNINGGGEASFFKILLRDSEDYLPLPPAFAKKYLEKPTNIRKQEVVLKTKSGDKWNVKYFKIEDGYYLVDGWLEFMKDNHLHNGDFIVFWLLSSPNSSKLTTFQVFPYAPNGCLKYTTCSTDDAAAARKLPAPDKEETSDTNDSSENIQQSIMSIVVKKSYTHRLPLKKKILEGKGVGGYGSLRLKNDEGKIWELAINKQGPEQRPWFTGGWCEFRKNNNIKLGNTCEFHHINANLFHVRVVKKRRRCVVESKSNSN